MELLWIVLGLTRIGEASEGDACGLGTTVAGRRNGEQDAYHGTVGVFVHAIRCIYSRWGAGQAASQACCA